MTDTSLWGSTDEITEKIQRETFLFNQKLLYYSFIIWHWKHNKWVIIRQNFLFFFFYFQHSAKSLCSCLLFSCMEGSCFVLLQSICSESGVSPAVELTLLNLWYWLLEAVFLTLLSLMKEISHFERKQSSVSGCTTTCHPLLLLFFCNLT